MGIIKTAKNIIIEVTESYLVKAGNVTELANKINIEAKKENLSISSNKKIQIHGNKK